MIEQNKNGSNKRSESLVTSQDQDFGHIIRYILAWYMMQGEGSNHTKMWLLGIDTTNQKIYTRNISQIYFIALYFSILSSKNHYQKKEGKGVEKEKDSIHLRPDYKRKKNLVDSDRRRLRGWR